MQNVAQLLLRNLERIAQLQMDGSDEDEEAFADAMQAVQRRGSLSSSSIAHAKHSTITIAVVQEDKLADDGSETWFMGRWERRLKRRRELQNARRRPWVEEWVLAIDQPYGGADGRAALEAAFPRHLQPPEPDWLWPRWPAAQWQVFLGDAMPRELKSIIHQYVGSPALALDAADIAGDIKGSKTYSALDSAFGFALRNWGGIHCRRATCGNNCVGRWCRRFSFVYEPEHVRELYFWPCGFVTGNGFREVACWHIGPDGTPTSYGYGPDWFSSAVHSFPRSVVRIEWFDHTPADTEDRLPDGHTRVIGLVDLDQGAKGGACAFQLTINALDGVLLQFYDSIEDLHRIVWAQLRKNGQSWLADRMQAFALRGPIFQ